MYAPEKAARLSSAPLFLPCLIPRVPLTLHGVVDQNAILGVLGVEGSLRLEHEAVVADLRRQQRPILRALICYGSTRHEGMSVRDVPRLPTLIKASNGESV